MSTASNEEELILNASKLLTTKWPCVNTIKVQTTRNATLIPPESLTTNFLLKEKQLFLPINFRLIFMKTPLLIEAFVIFPFPHFSRSQSLHFLPFLPSPNLLGSLTEDYLLTLFSLRWLKIVFGARASWCYKIVMAQALKICASNARALKQNIFRKSCLLLLN